MRMRLDGLATLKIGTRLRLGFGAVSALLIVVTALGVTHMHQMQARIDEITGANNLKSKLAMHMRDTVFERMIALRNISLVGAFASDMQDQRERIGQQEALYAETAKQLAALFAAEPDKSAKEIELLRKITASGEAAKPSIEKAIELAFAGQESLIFNVFQQLAPVQAVWTTALGELIALEERNNAQSAADARSSAGRGRALMLAIGVAAVLLGLLIAFLLTRDLTRKLGGEPGYAVDIADRIANGDFAMHIDLAPGDQSSVLHAMRRMRDKLEKMLGQVHASAGVIGVATDEIASGNLDLSTRTEQQAGSLAQTVSSLEALTATVKQNAAHAQQASQLATAASAVATEGGAVVARVTDTMDAIDGAARKIVDIIAVIDGIAFQTNILALNAAVEAARAGDQGRGFAVVAAEVRNLAQRSAGAAKEIKQLIHDSVEKVASGNRLADQAGATMADIVDSVRHVTDIIGAIAEASHAQHTGIEQVNDALGQMDRVTRQNGALVGQAAASACSLQQQALELTQLVGAFRLSEPAHAAPQPQLALMN